MTSTCPATTRHECLLLLGFRPVADEYACPAHDRTSCPDPICEAYAGHSTCHEAPPPTCEYLCVDDAACTAIATGRLIGTGGECGPLACWEHAKVGLDYEEGSRGYVPLPLLARFTF